MVGLVPVNTLVGKLGSSMAVVAGLTISFSVERSVRVRAGIHLFGFSLVLLRRAAPLLRTKIVGSGVEHSVLILFFFCFLFKITQFAGNN